MVSQDLLKEHDWGIQPRSYTVEKQNDDCSRDLLEEQDLGTQTRVCTIRNNNVSLSESRVKTLVFHIDPNCLESLPQITYWTFCSEPDKKLNFHLFQKRLCEIDFETSACHVHGQWSNEFKEIGKKLNIFEKPICFHEYFPLWKSITDYGASNFSFEIPIQCFKEHGHRFIHVLTVENFIYLIETCNEEDIGLLKKICCSALDVQNKLQLYLKTVLYIKFSVVKYLFFGISRKRSSKTTLDSIFKDFFSFLGFQKPRLNFEKGILQKHLPVITLTTKNENVLVESESSRIGQLKPGKLNNFTIKNQSNDKVLSLVVKEDSYIQVSLSIKQKIAEHVNSHFLSTESEHERYCIRSEQNDELQSLTSLRNSKDSSKIILDHLESSKKTTLDRILFTDNIAPSPVKIWVAPSSQNGDRSVDTILKRFSSNTPPTRKETMSHELLRLCTMHDLPNPGSVSFIRLSKAGFYYAGTNDEVVCFACGVKKGGWQNEDDPIQIHKRISPNCSFFSESSANIPVMYVEGQASLNFLSRDSSSANAVNATNREGRNVTDNPGRNDSGIGSSGGTSTGNYLTHADVNVSGRDSGIGANNSISSQERLQAITKHPQYSTFEKRLETYKDWPSNIRQNPRDLSQCGFFRSGNQDGVRCFRCGIGLRNWDPDDNPWVEHARWSPQCSYILEVKGQPFVTMIADAARQAETEQETDREENQPSNPQTSNEGSPSSAIAAASTSVPSTTDAMETDSLNQATDENRQKHAEAKVQNDLRVIENINGTAQTDKAETNQMEVAKSQNTEVKEKLSHNANTKTIIAANNNAGPGAEGGCNDMPNKVQCGIEASSRVSENNDEADPETLKKQIKEMSNLTICKICLDEKVSVVFLPCGHLVACAQCSPALRKCPICRQFIKGTVRTQIGN